MSGKQIEQLRKLKDLYDGGVVTNEEYFEKKKRLVDSLLLRVVLNLRDCGILNDEEARDRKLQLLGGAERSSEIKCSMGCGRTVIPEAIPCEHCAVEPEPEPEFHLQEGEEPEITCAEGCGRSVFHVGDICTDCLLNSLPELSQPAQPPEDHLDLQDSCYQDHTNLASRGHTRCPTCATKLVLEIDDSDEDFYDSAPMPPSAPKPRLSQFESEDSYAEPTPQPPPEKPARPRQQAGWKPAVTKNSNFQPRKPRIVTMERPVQTEMRCTRCGDVIQGRVMEKDRQPYDRVCYQLAMLDGANVKIGGVASHHERHVPNTFRVKPSNNTPGLK